MSQKTKIPDLLIPLCKERQTCKEHPWKTLKPSSASKIPIPRLTGAMMLKIESDANMPPNLAHEQEW